MLSLLTVVSGLLIMGLLVVIIIYDNNLMIERAKVKELQEKLNTIATRIYGSTDNFERAQVNADKRLERIIEDRREFKVAKECADKGIPRSNKVYPSRFKGW